MISIFTKTMAYLFLLFFSVASLFKFVILMIPFKAKTVLRAYQLSNIFFCYIHVYSVNSISH